MTENAKPKWITHHKQHSWHATVRSWELNGVILAHIQDCEGGCFWYGFGQNTCNKPVVNAAAARREIKAFLAAHPEIKI